MSDRPSDAPPTPEELAAASLLRDALDERAPAAGKDLALVRSLRAAWSPEALDELTHEAILDDAPQSAEELELAARLREDLDRDEAVLALRAAHAPVALDDAEHERIVARALEAAAVRGSNIVPLHGGPRRTRIALVTTTATVLALAASVVMWVTSGSSTAEAPLARARSTQPLFGEPFKAGETSARIDRIALARASDYRDNRFAKWGVR